MSIRQAEVDLADQGLILIQGRNNDDPAFDSNGAGKSTIFESICWNLFEKTVRGLSSKEIVNLNVGKNTSVILDLRDDDGSHIRIARYREHREHKNNVYIYKDNKNITPKSNKDSNLLIEDIVQMDYQTFTNSILFGQGLIKTFSVATDKEKKEILEKMLQMDEIKKCLEVAKRRLTEEKDKLTEIEAEESKTQQLIEEIEDTIEQLKLAEVEQTQKAEEELKELEEELKNVQAELQEHIENSEDYSETLEQLRKAQKLLQKKIDKYDEYEETKSSLKSDITATERDLRRLKRELDELEYEMEKIAEGKGTNCPACGQEISEETIEQSLRHVAVKLKDKKAEIEQTTSALEELNDDLDKIVKVLKKKEKYEEQMDEIKGEISEINAFIKSDENLRRNYEKQINNLNGSIQRIKSNMGKTYKKMIEQKSEQVKTLRAQIKGFDERKKLVETEIENLKFWVEAFGNAGIKSYLLDSVTPFLNERANRYLNRLAGNTTMVEFTTQTRLASGEMRDKFEIKISNVYGGNSYIANSTGERRRIDLAISLALQDLVMSRSNAKFNILLYDEIFDGLDAVGCENAIQLLQEMQQRVESIFVITHNDILKSYFDKYLVVTKEDGETKIHRE